MKNINQTMTNYQNKVRAAERVQDTYELVSPQDIKNSECLKRYYERKRRYPEMMRKREEERRKAEDRRAIILYFSPLVIRVLAIVIGLSISVGVTGWLDRVVFDYDIILTLVSCFFTAPMICAPLLAAGEWVIERIRVKLDFHRF